MSNHDIKQLHLHLFHIRAKSRTVTQNFVWTLNPGQVVRGWEREVGVGLKFTKTKCMFVCSFVFHLQVKSCQLEHSPEEGQCIITVK